MDVVYAIDTSNNVDPTLLSHVKRYVSASLQYFKFPTTATTTKENKVDEIPTGSETLSSQDGPVRAGVISFGDKSVQPIIQLAMSKDHPMKTYRDVINNLSPSDDKNTDNGIGQPADLIRMLNDAQQKMFAQSSSRPGTSPRGTRKRLLVVFINPSTKHQLNSPEVIRTIDDMKKTYGIQTAFVLIDDKGLNLNRLKTAVGNNLMVVARNGQSLPLLYPDFEKVVANTIGIFLLIYYTDLFNLFKSCLMETS